MRTTGISQEKRVESDMGDYTFRQESNHYHINNIYMESLESRVQTTLKSKISLEDYIQGILLVNRVRKAYLIQNFEEDNTNVDLRIDSIKKVFTELKHIRNANYTFLSLENLSEEDILDNNKIGELLGYKCSTQFDNLDHQQITYTYNIILTLPTSSDNIEIITYMCQDKSEEVHANNLTQSIKEVLMSDILLICGIEDVILRVDENKPASYLTKILLDVNHVFTEDDIAMVDDMIFNTLNPDTIHEIVQHIEYNNPIHRGFLLYMQSVNQHDTLYPFYPIQNSGHYSEVLQIMNNQTTFMADKILKPSRTHNGGMKKHKNKKTQKQKNTKKHKKTQKQKNKK